MLEAEPTSNGSVHLVLEDTALDGKLWLSAAMVQAAEKEGDTWKLRYREFFFRFDPGTCEEA